MGLAGFLLFLGGLFIAFYGQTFIRLAVALISGVWLGWLASSLASQLTGGVSLQSFTVGLVVFVIFFIGGFLKYRFTSSFFVSVALAYYAPTELLYSIVPGRGLVSPQEVLALKFLVFLGSFALTYTLFKLVIGLITSSLGSVLVYAGLAELGIPLTLTYSVTLVVFVASLLWYVSRGGRRVTWKT